MSDWIPFDQWAECARMERPGYVFEVAAADGRSLFTACVSSLPIPFDWKAQPTHFRIVPMPRPRHSTPIPPPAKPPQ